MTKVNKELLEDNFIQSIIAGGGLSIDNTNPSAPSIQALFREDTFSTAIASSVERNPVEDTDLIPLSVYRGVVDGWVTYRVPISTIKAVIREGRVVNNVDQNAPSFDATSKQLVVKNTLQTWERIYLGEFNGLSSFDLLGAPYTDYNIIKIEGRILIQDHGPLVMLVSTDGSTFRADAGAYARNGMFFANGANGFVNDNGANQFYPNMAENVNSGYWGVWSCLINRTAGSLTSWQSRFSFRGANSSSRIDALTHGEFLLSNATNGLRISSQGGPLISGKLSISGLR